MSQGHNTADIIHSDFDYLSIFLQSRKLLFLISDKHNAINGLVCVAMHYNSEVRRCRLSTYISSINYNSITSYVYCSVNLSLVQQS